MSPKRNNNDTILVTGGSRGIGAAICLRLARAGFDIWLNYLSNEREASKVQGEIEKCGRSCKLIPFDVSVEDEVNKALVPLLEQQPLYGYIHNAGVTNDAPIGFMSNNQWNTVIDVHLTSFFLISRLVVRSMVPERRGRIVVIGSISGETGNPGQFNYSAAKAGLMGASKTLSRELAKRNILVNVVSPGLIRTDMTNQMDHEMFVPLIPLGRFGEADEVAGLVNFLCSNEASYITGQVFSVNGGMLQ